MIPSPPRGRRFAASGAKRLRQAAGVMATVLVGSSSGYWVLGHLHHAGSIAPSLPRPWTFFECLYMTVITVSTIGYSETLPVAAGLTLDDYPYVRAYTIVVILTAMLMVGFAVSATTAFLVEGNLIRFWQTRGAMKRASELSDHYILCGCGVTGRIVLAELVATRRSVVVIDIDEAALEPHRDLPGVVCLVGDATEDDVLEAAGIDRAAGLAAALPSDKDNVFLIVTARRHQPAEALRIISLASSPAVQEKLAAVGANGVVSPSYIGGLRCASELFRPAVVTFLDTMLRRRDDTYRFAQLDVGERWSGERLGAVGLTEDVGLPVLAVLPAGATDYVFNPRPSHELGEGDVLVTMGDADTLDRARRILAGRHHEDGAGTEPLLGEA